MSGLLLFKHWELCVLPVYGVLIRTRAMLGQQVSSPLVESLFPQLFYPSNHFSLFTLFQLDITNRSKVSDSLNQDWCNRFLRNTQFSLQIVKLAGNFLNFQYDRDQELLTLVKTWNVVWSKKWLVTAAYNHENLLKNTCMNAFFKVWWCFCSSTAILTSSSKLYFWFITKVCETRQCYISMFVKHNSWFKISLTQGVFNYLLT